MRYNPNIDTWDELALYMYRRTKQLARYYYEPIYFARENYGGVLITKDSLDKIFYSPYIFAKHRGNGLYKDVCKKLLDITESKILTMEDCNMRNYLLKNDIDHKCLINEEGLEYKQITDYYGDKKAKKSGRDYMYHIDEGLVILYNFGADKNTRKAFCIHPIIQAGETDILSGNTEEVLSLATEYAMVAGSFLWNGGEILGGPSNVPAYSKEVGQMLIADKIQNFKDLQLYNFEHPLYNELVKYFQDWLDILGMTKIQYEAVKWLIR